MQHRSYHARRHNTPLIFDRTGTNTPPRSVGSKYRCHLSDKSPQDTAGSASRRHLGDAGFSTTVTTTATTITTTECCVPIASLPPRQITAAGREATRPRKATPRTRQTHARTQTHLQTWKKKNKNVRKNSERGCTVGAPSIHRSDQPFTLGFHTPQTSGASPFSPHQLAERQLKSTAYPFAEKRGGRGWEAREDEDTATPRAVLVCARSSTIKHDQAQNESIGQTNLKRHPDTSVIGMYVVRTDPRKKKRTKKRAKKTHFFALGEPHISQQQGVHSRRSSTRQTQNEQEAKTNKKRANKSKTINHKRQRPTTAAKSSQPPKRTLKAASHFP